MKQLRKLRPAVLQRLGKFSSRFLGAVVPHPRPADWAASCSIDSVSCRAASGTTRGIGRLGIDIKNLGLSGDKPREKRLQRPFLLPLVVVGKQF